MPVKIHNKIYKTVAERLNEIGEHLKSVDTVVLYTDPVVIKATIKTDRGTFSGISGANPNKSIEKNNPWEVAETSAVGRALAFAGYAGEEIASADEMQKAINQKVKPKPRPTTPKTTAEKTITNAQIRLVNKLLTETGRSKENMKKHYKVESTKDLTMSQASEVIERLKQPKSTKEMTLKDHGWD